jgi:predicted ArsR family transcriptional regulator
MVTDERHRRRGAAAVVLGHAELLELLDSPKTAAELAAGLGISINAVRKRLTTLRAADLVVQHGGHGQHTTYQRTT